VNRQHDQPLTDSIMTAKAPKIWVDKPWPLLQTPLFEQNLEVGISLISYVSPSYHFLTITSNQLNKETDQYLEVASKMCIIHNFLIRGLNSIYLQAPHVQSVDYADFIAYSRIWCEVTAGMKLLCISRFRLLILQISPPRE
jgi:hypothetical protein